MEAEHVEAPDVRELEKEILEMGVSMSWLVQWKRNKGPKKVSDIDESQL